MGLILNSFKEGAQTSEVIGKGIQDKSEITVVTLDEMGVAFQSSHSIPERKLGRSEVD